MLLYYRQKLLDTMLLYSRARVPADMVYRPSEPENKKALLVVFWNRHFVTAFLLQKNGW